MKQVHEVEIRVPMAREYVTGHSCNVDKIIARDNSIYNTDTVTVEPHLHLVCVTSMSDLLSLLQLS